MFFRPVMKGNTANMVFDIHPFNELSKPRWPDGPHHDCNDQALLRQHSPAASARILWYEAPSSQPWSRTLLGTAPPALNLLFHVKASSKGHQKTTGLYYRCLRLLLLCTSGSIRAEYRLIGIEPVGLQLGESVAAAGTAAEF